MKKVTRLLTLALGLIFSFGYTQTIEIEPKGIFKEIDVARHNEAIEILNGKDEALKQRTIDDIFINPNYYNPPVIYALSRELYCQAKKDEAAYWFYLAQLRARYDANLCMDNSAKQAVSVLNDEYGPDINKYAFQDIHKLESTVIRVVDFVKANEENYDHRWINLHGMDALSVSFGDKTEKIDLSQPEKKWAKIKQHTVDDYYNGFIEYVKSRK